MHDYQKKVTEKTDNISTIQKQIAAYSGDSSQEAMTRLQKLQKSLSDGQNDLNELMYDRYISDQQDMLDRLYEEYEELLTKKLDDFYGLVQEGLETANNNTAAIEDYLKNTADMNGYILETKGLFTGLEGNINENVNKIISAMATGATKDSGTVPNGQEEKPKTGFVQPVDIGVTPSIRETEPKDLLIDYALKMDKKGYRDIARKYIKKYASETKKPKKDYSDVNQKIYENKSGAYDGKGRVLSSGELEGLAKKLDVKYDGGKKDGKLYKKLKSIKFPGFKKGGVVSVDDIEKQVHENGDDGIVSVQNGEAILAPKQAEVLQQFTEKLPEADNAIRTPDGVELIPVRQEELIKEFQSRSNITHNQNNMVEPDLQDISNMIKQNVPDFSSMMKFSLPDVVVGDANNNINIDMGGITMNGVNDPKEFADQMIQSVQKYPKVQKAVRSVGIDRLAGSGRLSVNSIR